MKIEIDEKSYKFLKNLIDEIDQQDNRATASPYYYVVQEKRERVLPPGSDGDKILYYHDGEYMEASEWADALEFDTEEKFLEWWNDEYPYEEPLRVEYYMGEPELSNVFFTEKACHKHIEQNHYHFRNPRSYVKHAWRNPEINELFEVIRKIVKGK